MGDGTIFYDGLIFKVAKINNKTQLATRYFQITKNSFRYYRNIYDYIIGEKPLVQFDIRIIKNIEILGLDFIDWDVVEEYKIKFIFRISLKGKKDIFVFATDDKKVGISIINVLSLLIDYYDKNLDE